MSEELLDFLEEFSTAFAALVASVERIADSLEVIEASMTADDTDEDDEDIDD